MWYPPIWENYREHGLTKRHVAFVIALFSILTFCASAQELPYKVNSSKLIGGEGGFDYVFADSENRYLYIPRLGDSGRISVFNLDTLESIYEIPDISGHGVAVSEKSSHGFASSKPVAMWDAKTLSFIKYIDVDGSPDGILYEPYTDAILILSHKKPSVTALHANDGTIAGTIDIGAAPEEAVSDGSGTVYLDIEDKDAIAVIDIAKLKLAATYPLKGMGGACAGLALDKVNGILFVACRTPNTMVVMNAHSGEILTSLPIGHGTDGAVFNPRTLEAFSSNADGTLTIIKEASPRDFFVEQTLETAINAKTLTLDIQTDRIFLVAAQFGPASNAPLRGRYPNRGPMLQGSFRLLEVGR
jgi:DNA-binding beta-propeller fold protein YncE